MEVLIRPQFVYTPEGTLDFTTRLDDVYYPGDTSEETLKRMAEAKTRELDDIEAFDGVNLEEKDDSVVTVSVEVERLLAGLAPNEYERAAQLIFSINNLLTYYPQDLVDRVVGIDVMTDRGSNVVVNQHFQNWMQSPNSFNEEVARKAIEAMALPFASNRELTTGFKRDMRTRYRYYSDDSNYFAGFSAMFGISLRQTTFRISRIGRSREEGEKYGEVEWFWPNISTFGNCACWGVDGAEREHTTIDDATRRLYEMTPHNVDYSIQALSHLMALGVLSYEASLYKGEEDVFDRVEWRQE